MLKRYKPLKRGGPIKRTARPRHASPQRAKERREYTARQKAYLALHPFDQIKIAFCGFDEADVLRRAVGLNRSNCDGIYHQGQLIPTATEIHHRNKGHGARLLDERWWMSASRSSHEHIESNKTWARGNGFLLPIQADAEGRWGSGNQALTTPEFMEAQKR